MKTDKEIERDRYESRARDGIHSGNVITGTDTLSALPPALQAPYRRYARCIRESIADSLANVLEIGAGTGAFSAFAVETGARVIATDISESSLVLLRRRLGDPPNLETRVADMEALPFDDASFDAVLSAGSLSYGDNDVVMREIHRVLKPRGRFVCVDSLNHNPVYRLNRWIQYLLGQRTRSTIERMPTMRMIQSYRDHFGSTEASFFGALSWLTPLLEIFMPAESVGEFSDKIDARLGVSKSAFKFVMVAEKPGL